MERVYECCCGMDVHKKMVVACLQNGRKQQLRQFSTMTGEIKLMAEWLLEQGCEQIAMESTASYWKPIYNVLEAMGLSVIVVNAQHMKAVPGRKTDMKDAQWIAQLLQHGLLKASYIPCREQRELRELTRYKKSLVEERARELNRFQKILEGANIKLGSVVRDINGASSRRIMERLIRGEEINKEVIKKNLAKVMLPKLEEIMQSIDGVLTPLQQRLLQSIQDHIDDMARRIAGIDDILQDYLAEYQEAIKKLDAIPGIGTDSAQVILAEIGLDMSRFPSAAHLCSWAGICPGNHTSAGKSKTGRTTHGNQTLKATLVQCAKSAQKTKDSFFNAQYQRISVRRGKNRASVAVAHSLLIAIYHILKKQEEFHDLGINYYPVINKERKIKSYLKQLEKLGWSPPAETAT